MIPFDQRADVVERREQATMTQRPVVPASHPGARDPHDGAEDDEEVGAGGGAPGEAGERAGHEPRNMRGFSREYIYPRTHVSARPCPRPHTGRPLGRAPTASARPLER